MMQCLNLHIDALLANNETNVSPSAVKIINYNVWRREPVLTNKQEQMTTDDESAANDVLFGMKAVLWYNRMSSDIETMAGQYSSCLQRLQPVLMLY